MSAREAAKNGLLSEYWSTGEGWEQRCADACVRAWLTAKLEEKKDLGYGDPLVPSSDEVYEWIEYEIEGLK